MHCHMAPNPTPKDSDLQLDKFKCKFKCKFKYYVLCSCEIRNCYKKNDAFTQFDKSDTIDTIDKVDEIEKKLRSSRTETVFKKLKGIDHTHSC